MRVSRVKLDEEEKAYIKAHAAEVDTLIDGINEAQTVRTTGVRVWYLMEYIFRLGREYEREETY